MVEITILVAVHQEAQEAVEAAFRTQAAVPELKVTEQLAKVFQAVELVDHDQDLVHPEVAASAQRGNSVALICSAITI